MIRLAIRGYAAGVLQFEDLLLLDACHLNVTVSDAAHRHAEALAAHDLHMVEIEFLDEPDPMQRFFRLGTDSSGMVIPIRWNLSKEDA